MARPGQRRRREAQWAEPPLLPPPALPSGGPSVGDEPGATALGWHRLGGQEVSQGMPGSSQVLKSLCPGLPFPARGVEGERQEAEEAGELELPPGRETGEQGWGCWGARAARPVPPPQFPSSLPPGFR